MSGCDPDWPESNMYIYSDDEIHVRVKNDDKYKYDTKVYL